MMHQTLAGQPITEAAPTRLSECIAGLPLFVAALLHIFLDRETLISREGAEVLAAIQTRTIGA
jgi:hypothetical protein